MIFFITSEKHDKFRLLFKRDILSIHLQFINFDN